MYNEYMTDNFYHNQFEKTDNETCNAPTKSDGIMSKFTFPEINSETLILFAVIFFAIYDDFDIELLIIIGVLFILGI